MKEIFNSNNNNNSQPNTPNFGKPLPPIQNVFPKDDSEDTQPEGDADDARPRRVAERIGPSMRASSPERTIKGKTPTSVARKRRSMSVSDADIKKAMAATASERVKSSLSREWDSGSEYSSSGIVKDLKGELSSQLDPISTSSLDLKDPSTPKKATFDTTDPPTTLSDARGKLQDRAQRPQLRMALSSPTTVTTSSIASTTTATTRTSTTTTPSLSVDTTNTNSEDVIAPPRSSSLVTPIKTPDSIKKIVNVPTVKYGPRSQRPNSTNIYGSGPASATTTVGRDASRLRVQHRSTASSSEPSLIPVYDDDRLRDPKRTVRLVPSSNSVAWSDASSPSLSLYLSSQTDLNEDIASGNGSGRATTSKPPRDDPIDIESNGRESAVKCWTEDEDFLAKEKIAEWLGGTYVENILITFLSLIFPSFVPFLFFVSKISMINSKIDCFLFLFLLFIQWFSKEGGVEVLYGVLRFLWT